MTAFPVTASSAELKVLLTQEPPEDLPKVEEPGFCQDVPERLTEWIRTFPSGLPHTPFKIW